ncbi:MAG: aminotransferase class V-fold PLP-dependent enzyme [Terrisporobacter othiniensis]|uniref:threonine aldolase family protein n=1 Tax=Terrisporobacter petrolearius TaxID=1460447 RepID=UPI0022E07030|nr:aminotransferase class I/II-fold pyridoxal phosphate-dependent enzyme [Terrisporobacter petrolearius]MDU4862174.1 aminotransferase class V-fold PLP-dependent enzyme [Terrisporobacter othiniensis]MDU6995773.1 aminotransferase class V-fold PLP-dependent enzyme [Terrisporobacter othiniensis]
MYSFTNDYSEGAHESILKALLDSNLKQSSGYGLDEYSEKAKDILKNVLKSEKIDIHFIPGGTQVNLICISSFLKQYEAAIAADTGHIAVHETGAIEACGHKVITAPSNDGKLTVDKIEKILKIHTDEHMVKPKLVYISNATEIGTIYKKQELIDLYTYCREKNLLFFIDGARMGSAITSEENDLQLCDLVNLCDAFYIGATKNGALFGEALVICNDSLKEDFRYNIKQKGALLAKGRLLGIQFVELFKDDLFFNLAKHANEMAALIQDALIEENYKLLIKSPTNQIFPILPNSSIEKLREKYSFNTWEEYDENHTVIRLVTSWATEKDKVLDFINDLRNL